MKKTRIVIDLNANVESISATITVKDKIALADIAFFNNTGKSITDIKFRAVGYNAFNEKVLIDGKESFSFTVQDIFVEPYREAGSIQRELPDNNIRKLKLYEDQIRYSDGSISTYAGADNHTYDVTEYDDTDSATVESLAEIYGIQFVYVPEIFEEGWLCGCGSFNRQMDGICPCCGNRKEELLQLRNRNFVADVINKREEAKEKKKKNDQRRSFIKGLIAVFALCAIVGCGFLVYHLIDVNNRKHYDSVTEMQMDLIGTWKSESLASYSTNLYYVIGNDYVERIINSANSEPSIRRYDEIQWYPDKGYISIAGNDDKNSLVIAKDNSIHFDRSDGKAKFIRSSDNAYKNRSENTSKKTTTNYTYTRTTATPVPYESGEKVLKISNVKLTSNTSYMIIEGTVTNNGDLTYDYVKVKGMFLDDTGTVVDTDWTYAVGGEHLRPGESSTFSMSTKKSPKIFKARVELLDYEVSK